MKESSVWDTLSKKYDRLWVQKHSLAPTRETVSSIIGKHFSQSDSFSLLDIGCGTGQLLAMLKDRHPDSKLYGLDKSLLMIRELENRNKSITAICADIDICDISASIPNSSMDAVVCCHSFPYYKDKTAVIEKASITLRAQGLAIFVQASINNGYDKVIMRAVESTAEKADYLSREAFRKIVESHFDIVNEFTIRKRIYMPSICGFTLRKKG